MRPILMLLIIPLLAGCISSDSDEAETPAALSAPEDFTPAVFSGGRVHVDVEVPVILVGFPEGAADSLAGWLSTLRPDAETYNNARLLSGGFLNGAGGTRPVDPDSAQFDQALMGQYRWQEAGDLLLQG